ncbi:MAG: hypothetical protein WC365_02065 [Candidatus Babeliales bacterium]|jgi:hypothetical protein
MISKTTKWLQAVKALLFAALCMSGLSAHTEFKRHDQAFVFFKAADGFKFPYMMVCKPALNQWNMVLCGAVKNGTHRFIKHAEDLENIVPLRNTIKFGDSGTKIDKKYQGFREANIAILLELFFRSVGLMSNEGYAGKVLVDEYAAGLPMKWVLGSIEHFRALRNYMTNALSVPGAKLPSQKPLLMIEFLDGKADFNEDDKTFLTNCFEVLDPTDAEACAFFDRAQTKLAGVMDATSSAKQVKEDIGEMFLNRVEDYSSLETKKVVLGLSAAVAFYFLIAPVTDTIKAWGAHVAHLPQPKKSNN